MKTRWKKVSPYVWLVLFVIFIAYSFVFGFQPGKEISFAYKNSLVEMIVFLPPLFVMMGLFDVWVPQEIIQKHTGPKSGIKGIALVALLGMLQAGPLYVAFPVAYMLWKKGASIRNIFIYLGTFSSLKIPLLGIEIAYLGIHFTLVRTLVSLPLFIAIGFLMERYLKDKEFKVNTIE